jgi:hypothetical protein
MCQVSSKNRPAESKQFQGKVLTVNFDFRNALKQKQTAMRNRIPDLETSQR